MDTNKRRLISNVTTIEVNGWKSKDRRNMMVKKMWEEFTYKILIIVDDNYQLW